MKLSILKIFLTFLLLVIPSRAIAQYDPLLDSPSNLLDKVSTELNEREVIFDPEKGIFVPDEKKFKHKNLNPSKRHEDYLLKELEKTNEEPEEEEDFSDSDDSYMTRQLKVQLKWLAGYTELFMINCKKIFIRFWSFLGGEISSKKELDILSQPLPLAALLSLIVLVYVLCCIPLKKIARTVSRSNQWMAWVPIVNLVLLLIITERSKWTLILFFIPLVNLVLLVVVFSEISELFQQSKYYGWLILVPGLNIALLWYLAYVGFD